MCRLKGARKPCVGIAQQVAALMAPGKHLLKLLNGGDDRGRGAAKKKQVPKLRNGCGDQEKPNTKNVEIAQRLWRHPIEHTDDSPQIPPYPLGRIRKKEAISKPRIAQKVVATRGAKKRNVATKGKRKNRCVESAQWMWRFRGANKKETCWKCARGRIRSMCSNCAMDVATQIAQKAVATKEREKKNDMC